MRATAQSRAVDQCEEDRGLNVHDHQGDALPAFPGGFEQAHDSSSLAQAAAGNQAEAGVESFDSAGVIPLTFNKMYSFFRSGSKQPAQAAQ